MTYPLDIIVEKAKEFAHEAHDSIGQKRKYSGLPYWVHTDEVAELVATVTDDQEMIAAAHLHDVVEDVDKAPYDLRTIMELFGARVASLVFYLTNVYTRDIFPHLNRAERHKYEAERLAKESPDVQTIKYADIICNTRDIVKQDPKFAKIYLAEKRHLISLMTKGEATLREKAYTNCLPVR